MVPAPTTYSRIHDSLGTEGVHMVLKRCPHRAKPGVKVQPGHWQLSKLSPTARANVEPIHMVYTAAEAGGPGAA